MFRGRGCLLALATVLTAASAFEPIRSKENPKIEDEEYKGKTAWIQDLPVVQYGAFASSMCVDGESGALIEAIYDNPGVVRIDPGVTGNPFVTELDELPYPSSVVCDGSRNAYVASSISPASVAALALSRNGDMLIVKSQPIALPAGCGGVLLMKYSRTLDLLVASCGMPPASIVLINIDRSNEEQITLLPQNRTFISGQSGRSPFGLAVFDSGESTFALVGVADGSIVKVSLPDMELVERRETDAKNLGMFSIGNNENTLLMFSPFPWRRVLVMHLNAESLAGSELLSVSLDQDMEFVTDVFLEPATSVGYVVGNSERGIPAVLQLDANHAHDVWGIILAGVCKKASGYRTPRRHVSNTTTAGGRRKGGTGGGGGGARGGGVFGGGSAAAGRVAPVRTGTSTGALVGGGHNPVNSGVIGGEGGQPLDYQYWCEWGPKGRFAHAAALDVGGGRAGRMYIGVTAKYCAHCDDWHDDNDRRCKDGKEQEDYYDRKTYCLQEEWNMRNRTYGGNLSAGEVDVLSNKAWGGDNSSTLIMQLGSIPKIGGVSGAGSLAPGVLFAALAAAAALFRVRST